MMPGLNLSECTGQATVSIIVPVYNVKKYLERCLDSIKNQTYENIEVILVDDGSNDGSGEICDLYAANDERFHTYHQSNGGLSAARNTGLEHASGKYVAFVDSDDWISSDMIEKIMTAAELHTADIICFDYYVSYADNEKQISKYITDGIEIIQKEKALSLLIANKIESYACMKFYKRSMFEQIEYPVGKKYEDIGTTYKLFLKADRICYYPEAFYHYWQREDSISHLSKKTNVQYLCDTQDIFNFKKDMEAAIGSEYPQLSDQLQAATEEWAIKLYNASILFKNCEKNTRISLQRDSYKYLASRFKDLKNSPLTSRKHKYRLVALIKFPWIYNNLIAPYYYKKRGNVS